MRNDMKKDFKKDLSKRRDDSPLRWPANVHHTTNHDERIRWLLYENEKMYGELLTAKLLNAVVSLKFKANRKVFTNLAEYKAVKQCMELWEQVLEEENSCQRLALENWRHTKDSSYYFFGDEEESEK